MLEVDGLRCGYGDFIAVDGVSFRIGPGEIFGLIGANGAGKTATILALAGLIPVRNGKVRMNGSDITGLSPMDRSRRGIALVPEGRRVFADLSVDENLTVGGSLVDRKRLEGSRSRVYEAFPKLAERASQAAGSLSGGEQQMLAIGRAMMADPKLLLIDELSLGLMPTAIDDCYDVLRSLRRGNLAILLVEQSTDRVVEAADRMAVIETGRIVWEGTGAEASGDEAIAKAYLGLESDGRKLSTGSSSELNG